MGKWYGLGTRLWVRESSVCLDCSSEKKRGLGVYQRGRDRISMMMKFCFFLFPSIMSTGVHDCVASHFLVAMIS